ncbi:hypothetical protein D3C87_601080 [compost metagenome]
MSNWNNSIEELYDFFDERGLGAKAEAVSNLVNEMEEIQAEERARDELTEDQDDGI